MWSTFFYFRSPSFHKMLMQSSNTAVKKLMTSKVMTDTEVNSNPVQSFRVNIFIGIKYRPCVHNGGKHCNCGYSKVTRTATPVSQSRETLTLHRLSYTTEVCHCKLRQFLSTESRGKDQNNSNN